MRKEEFLVGGGKSIAARYGDPALPVLIFFAGWGAELLDYEERLSEISKDFHIIAFNLPGFGYGEPLEGKDNTVRGHALFFINIIEQEIKLDSRAVFMGHSTGAGVAAVVATEIPHLVSDLVLICPVGSPDPISRSGIRLIKNINWSRAKRWFSGDYRRRFIPNMLLGIDAKHLNLVEDIKALRSQPHLRMRLFLAKEDNVAPAGLLANSIDVEHIRWVDGGHSWFKHNADAVHEELLTLRELRTRQEVSPCDLSFSQRVSGFFVKLKESLQELFVPSLPILLQSVENANQQMKESNEDAEK